jgi:hypothetical protein
MKNYFKDKNNIIIAAITIFILIVIVLIIFSLRKSPFVNQNNNSKVFKGQIINDIVKIPNTVLINNNEGEIVPRGEYNVKLQPKSETEQVFISNAKVTLKGAYTLTQTAANNWASDQKLIFIKSNGALGLDGLSSSWQVVYGSAQKKRAYEIIISADQIISQKEIKTESTGFDLPSNWYDSNEAIASLGHLPQFSADTISAISFYYSEPASSWAYGVATGEKTTSMWVK